MSPRSLLTFLALPFAFASALRAEFPTPTNNQPETIPLTPPEKALEMMHLPPGFKATVFAHEPDVQQPIAMCWDDRGRLWIAENYTYSDGKERFDLSLRDRILIFEDSKNTGHFDKRTVFTEDLQMLTSIERGFGGVYALCPPNLLWIPEKDGLPSGPPQVVLDGFSTTASSRHTFANGLKWGLDGWLYGRIGITSTSLIAAPGVPDEKRQPTAGGVWRYDPVHKIFEPYCHGTTNPWGMDWDEHGEMFFINTVIGHLWHGIQGAHFKRMHGEDPYPHIYGLIDQHADHYHWDTGKKWNETRDATGLTDTLGGGHAHVGMMIYQGTNFPKEYRGKLFTTNLHGHRVNVDRLDREGSGYVGRHEPDFMKSDDPWFRATEIQYGPDGGVYVLDWSDIGECHEQDGVHRTSGRIYKITYGDPVKPKETDMTKLSDDQLVQLQLSDNEWLVRMARWELRERASIGKTSPDTFSSLLRLPLAHQDDPFIRLKTYWALASLQPDGAILPLRAHQFIEQADLIKSTDDEMAWGIRYFVENYDSLLTRETKEAAHGPNANPVAKTWLKDIFVNCDSARRSPRLRLVLASQLSKCPAEYRSEAAALLLAHGEDVGDHNLPLMYWYGIHDFPPAELVKLAKDCRIPLVRQYISRRATEEIDKDPAPLNALFDLASESKVDGLSADILTGMTDALKGWRKAKKPAAWDAFAAKVATASDANLQKTLRDLNVLFGDGRALDEVRAIALDPEADVEARRSALRTIVEAKSPDARQICEKLLPEHSLGLDAVQGLAAYDDPAIAEAIVKRWRNFYANEHNAVVAALASRPSFAKVLLAHMGDGLLQHSDITPVIARQIRSFNDEALTKKLTEVWGDLRESSEDKLKLIATLKTKLTPEVIAKADPSQGRLTFSQVCAVCHRLYGEGHDIGPDLTGSGRHDINYLLENIVDPSAIVAADFKMSVITLKDGRVLNGILHGQSDHTLTVKMIGQDITVEKSEITKQEQLPISMMPEGLLTAFGEEQTRNLIAYLMTNGQVPLPAAK